MKNALLIVRGSNQNNSRLPMSRRNLLNGVGMNKTFVLSYNQRELIIGALSVYADYLVKPQVKRTYPKSPVTAKDTLRLENKFRKAHFKK